MKVAAGAAITRRGLVTCHTYAYRNQADSFEAFKTRRPIGHLRCWESEQSAPRPTVSARSGVAAWIN